MTKPYRPTEDEILKDYLGRADGIQQAQDEMNLIAQGRLGGFEAQHPMSLAYAQERAKWGYKGPANAPAAPAHVQADPARVATAQAQLDRAPRVGETQGQYEARQLASPNNTEADLSGIPNQTFTPPKVYDSSSTAGTAPHDRWAAAQARTNGQAYSGPAGSNPTAADFRAANKAAMAKAMPIDATIESLYADPSSAIDQSIPLGRLLKVEDAVYRNDPEGPTAMAWSAAKADYVPRDELLTKAAKSDVNIARAFQNLQSERRNIQTQETLEPGQQFGNAMMQNERKLNTLAHGAHVDEPPTFDEEVAQNSYTSPDGSMWYRGPDGKLTKIGVAPHERVPIKDASHVYDLAYKSAKSKMPEKLDKEGNAVDQEPDGNAVVVEAEKFLEFVDKLNQRGGVAGSTAASPASQPAAPAKGQDEYKAIAVRILKQNPHISDFDLRRQIQAERGGP